MDAPPPLTALDNVDPEVRENFWKNIIIALLEKAGGKADIPVADLHRVSGEFVFGWRWNIPNAPTGDIKIDAIEGGKLMLELRRFQ